MGLKATGPRCAGANLLRLGAYTSLALGAALLVGLWWTAFCATATHHAHLNSRRASTAPTPRRRCAKAGGGRPQLLEGIAAAQRAALPADSYASRGEGEPIMATFGLSQRPRLRSAAETSYRAGLERLFRPRLIFRLEEQLEAKRANAGFIYEALKVYLMLGGRAEVPLDRNLVVNGSGVIGREISIRAAASRGAGSS